MDALTPSTAAYCEWLQARLIVVCIRCRTASSCSLSFIAATVVLAIGLVLPENVQHHRAATSDCPFENARLRGSGALHRHAAFTVDYPSGNSSVDLTIVISESESRMETKS